MKITSDMEKARSELRKMLRPGQTVYTILRHRARSGMFRTISLIIIKNGKPIQLDWWIDRAGWGKRSKRHDGLEAHGCGMDMGFNKVYHLGDNVWPNGTRKPHGTRNGEPDTAGGYALKHQWL